MKNNNFSHRLERYTKSKFDIQAPSIWEPIELILYAGGYMRIETSYLYVSSEERIDTQYKVTFSIDDVIVINQGRHYLYPIVYTALSDFVSMCSKKGKVNA